jgi:hypothetical protein
MRRGALAAVAASLSVLLLVPGAGASHDPSGEPFGEDFVVGSFSTDFRSTTNVDAHSGPSGENPTGEVRIVTPRDVVPGTVTCLNVAGNRATIGIDVPDFFGSADLLIFVEDNDRAEQDEAAVVSTSELPLICPTNPSTALSPVVVGDITVHDAVPRPTSKDQCKNGGWRNFPGFKNQGECVAFVERHPQP